MKKLLALVLALSLTLSLSLPAFAWEEPDTKYSAFEQYLDFYRASPDPETKELVFWLDAWIAAHPDKYAAFDPDAWFAGYYGSALGITKESYLEHGSLDEAGFRRDMFAEWAGGERCRYNGFVITVDGAPILFEPVVYDGMSIPGAVDGRIRAPLPTLETALGFQRSYDKQTGTLTCTKGEQTVRLTEGDGIFQTNVHLYVPLRALAEGLGYTVTWNQTLWTAQLTTNP